MGADITLHTKDEKIYFRDAYNLTNLAWVINESYWANDEKNKIAFMEKLSKITDEQIEERCSFLFTQKRNEISSEENLEDWIKMFKDKRSILQKAFSTKVIKVTWSV
jgi:hypothetical protein